MFSNHNKEKFKMIIHKIKSLIITFINIKLIDTEIIHTEWEPNTET